MLDLPCGVRGGRGPSALFESAEAAFYASSRENISSASSTRWCIRKKQGIDRRVFLFGDHIGFRGRRENRKIMRRLGLRLVAGALPLDQAILERDLMQLAKTPAKLKKSIFRTAVFRQSLRIYVT